MDWLTISSLLLLGYALGRLHAYLSIRHRMIKCGLW